MKRVVKIFLWLSLSLTSLLAAHPQTQKLLDEIKKELVEISAQELYQMSERKEKYILLDVREVDQRAEGEIYADETMAITRGNLEFKIFYEIPDKNTAIVTYCRVGSHAALAAYTLKKLGYNNVRNLQGGLLEWIKAGYPVEPGF